MKTSAKVIAISVLIILGFLGLSIKSMAQQFVNAGKIWQDESHIYVNIVDKGILVIENYDPRNPKKVGFIDVPGNIDLAISGTTLYANSFNDLVTIDITDLKNVQEKSRIPGVFSQIPRNSVNGSAVAWRTGSEMENALSNILNGLTNNRLNLGNLGNTNNGLIGGGLTGNGLMGNGMVAMNQPNQTGNAGSKGGSMACFTLSGKHLYAIDSRNLYAFDLTNPHEPKRNAAPVQVNFDIETIFPSGDKLFIGSQSGMYIYSIQNPEQPVRLGRYEHTRSCDPVVVEGNYAYVTLRNGNDCDGQVNQLDVIDISNPSRPRKIVTHNMTNPHGLAIDNGTLFICDGRDGLKVFDAKDPYTIKRNQIGHFQGITAYDVIPVSLQKRLVMVGSNQIFQYDYSNPSNVQLLSTINVGVIN
ncbi:MAG: hypothetical protein EAZ57_09970 [Cytophagales bacterium]|nr:MAG: hypothetical protein EAZ67_10500 [Cytophagales bacterium]TAF59769.1 MAG: hypothetical protein EAZ57_09970 [Cytophagales bacterium]